jgi:MtN3 and saliva related transmembrane protein
MNSVEIEMIGLVAAILVNAASVPQVVKTVTTKQVRDLSLPFWVVLLTGALLWIVYGTLTYRIALVASSLVTCCLCSTMIVLILKYR